MISVLEAEKIIKAHQPNFGTEVLLLEETPGRILAEVVRADRPQPPFNRATMDGIALRLNEEGSIFESYEILDLLAAGADPAKLKKTQQENGAIEIMTGASVPQEYNCVIPYEDISISDGKVSFNDYESLSKRVRPFLNIHPRANDFDRGHLLLEPGCRIGSAQIAILASCGFSKVTVRSLPKILVISTGDELVSVDVSPEPHQIRQSNRYSIYAELNLAGFKDTKHIHLTDDPDTLEKEVLAAFSSYDIIIFSGAISKGKFDFIPSLLLDIGVDLHFHGVKQKPGKPFLFGSRKVSKRKESKNGETLIFGLPGNPVSSIVCLRRYVLPLLTDQLGKAHYYPLAQNFEWNSEKTFFPAVKVRSSKSKQLELEPMAGNGSGDFFQLAGSDGFIQIDKNEGTKGALVPYFPWK